MAYKIRFTIKRSSPTREIAKHTWGVIRPLFSRQGDALFLASTSAPVTPYSAEDATIFPTYHEAVAALSFWYASEDRASGSLWVKNPRILRHRG